MTNEEENTVSGAAFAIETAAHMRGLEAMLLPYADALRGLLPCPDCNSNQRFVRRVGLGGFECANSWHFAQEDTRKMGKAERKNPPSYEELAGLVKWLCVEHEASIMPITVIARVHEMYGRLK